MELKEIAKKISPWIDWRDRYNEFVPRFIQEAKTKVNWTDWEPSVFYEYFERTDAQCISSLKQGYFTLKEREAIKAKWYEVGPILKAIAEEQAEPIYENYKKLEDTISPLLKNNRNASIQRMVAGLQPKLLCTIVTNNNLGDLHSFIRQKIGVIVPSKPGNWYFNSNQMLNYFRNELPDIEEGNLLTYPWQTLDYFKNPTKTSNENRNEMEENEYIELLKYKKQIILQGPPGTGKTWTADLIAKQLIGSLKDISTKDVKHFVSVGLNIPVPSGKNTFSILSLDEHKIKVKPAGAQHEYSVSLEDIIICIQDDGHNKPVTESDAKGTASYKVGLAKFLAEAYQKELDKQMKLIQFHPSYNYEDFVRGIVSLPNKEGDGIMYEAQNKIFGEFAAKALENYVASRQVTSQNSQNERALKEKLFQFGTHVQELLDVSPDRKYYISDNVFLSEFDGEKFRYKGDNWSAHPNGLNMKLTQLVKVVEANLSDRNAVVKAINLDGLTRSHATYFFNTVQKFKEFVDSDAEMAVSVANAPPELEKSFVIILDEINRANLSSVLGELIYALEYRNSEVQSMYEVDGSNTLILPPNLYIIGTMNTADRSVGHIDYAIRRRFAFVEMLPENLGGEDFEGELFEAVSKFFVQNSADIPLKKSKHLSSEFRPEDVWLGHSYFIKKEGVSSLLRLEYEIMPILREYIKDGILLESEGLTTELNHLKNLIRA